MKIPTEVIDKYVKRVRRDLGTCLSSIECGRYKEIEKIGHQLKGNGSTFGYPELSNIGKKLELAAKGCSLETLHQSLGEFSIFVHQLTTTNDG